MADALGLDRPQSRIVLMYASGEGPPSQLHFSDGVMLRPVATSTSDSTTVNTYAVPLAYKSQAERMGLEAASGFKDRMPQGPTSGRPATPSDSQYFFDWGLGQIIVWKAAQNAWVRFGDWRPST